MGAAITQPLLDFARDAMGFLAQYQECVATGTWARLVFEMC
jgi:hypothetical protein